MLSLLLSFLLLIVAYLLGSVPFAVIVTRIMGLHDPRTYGSGNPGATNVLRSGNKKAALLTLLGDALKGALAVGIALFAIHQNWGVAGWVLPLSAGLAFIGHIYPIFLRFQGGKGVATALGVLLAWHPLLALVTSAIWLMMLLFFHYSSLAAVVAAIMMPMVYVMAHQSWWEMDSLSLLVLCTMSVLLLFRHQQNIANLMRGTESKVGKKKGSSTGVKRKKKGK